MSDKGEVRPIDANALCAILQAKADMVLLQEYKHAFLNVIAMVNAIPTIDAVPMDEHKKRMEAETKKRVLAEETNRQILENYAPVVHAKWIMDDNGIHRCLNCSERLPFIHCYSEETDEEWDEEIEETLYCHHCGAKMDGGNDDENA